MGGESGVVLYAREALLLGRRDDLAVTDQAGGTVMIISGYPEDIYRLHSLPEFSDVIWFFYPTSTNYASPEGVAALTRCHRAPRGKRR
jgi:hypothetical protein